MGVTPAGVAWPAVLRGPVTRTRVAVAGVIVPALVLVVDGAPVAGLLVLVVAATAVRSGAARRRERQARVERDRVAEFLGALALELGSGRAAGAALLAAAGGLPDPRPPAVAAAALAVRTAGDVPAALAGGSPTLRGLGAAWRVSARTGAPLAGAVDRLAEGLRAEAAVDREVDAALAGPRSSARLLAGLPVLGLLLAAGLGAHPAHVLLHTALGTGCLALGTALDLAGSAWTGALVRSARRAA